jgi:hypothetical protein
MAVEAELSTSDDLEAFSLLEAFWTAGGLGPEPSG